MFFRWLERTLTFKPDQTQYADISRYQFSRHEIVHNLGSTIVYSHIKESGPVVLFSHGNTGNVTFHTKYYELFMALGVSFVAYDYPGYGESKGLPSEKALFESGVTVMQYLQESLGIDSKRIIHFGLSLGGAVSIHIASEMACAGVILECTFTDSQSVGKYLFKRLPLYKFVPNRFRNTDKIGQVSSPILILHGGKDETIPVFMAHELYAKTSGRRELFIVENAGHADIGAIGGDDYTQRIKEFIQTCR